MNRNQFLLGDAAKALNVPPYRITYLLTTHRIPEPRRVGGRRVFTKTALSHVAKVLGIDLPEELKRGKP